MQLRLSTEVAMRSRIESVLPALAKIRKITGQPSLSFGVMHKGKVIHQHAEGYIDAGTKRPVDKDTGYLLGSCTKAFIAAAISVLVDQGRLSWDTKLRSIIPFRHNSDQYISEHLTIADALCHRTGLDRLDLSWYGQYGVELLTKDHLLDVVANLPVAAEPRTKWGYSNHMYGVLGLVIDAVAPESNWGSFLSHEIFKPLGLDRSGTDTSEFPDDNFAEAHMAVSEGGSAPVMRSGTSDKTAMGPAGGVYSTVPNLLKWTKAVLQVATSGFDEATSSGPLRNYQTALAHHMVKSVNTAVENTYGFGWQRVTIPSAAFGPQEHPIGEGEESRLAFLHAGLITGFQSSICMVPSLDLAVVALSNGQGYGDITDWTIKAVVQAVSDFPHQVDLVAAASKKAEDIKENFQKLTKAYELHRNLDSPIPPLADLVGLYTLDALTLSLRIQFVEGRLDSLEMRINDWPSQRRQLHHFDHDSFGFPAESLDEWFVKNLIDYKEWYHTVLNFEKGKSGAFESLTWKMSDAHPPYRFHKSGH